MNINNFGEKQVLSFQSTICSIVFGIQYVRDLNYHLMKYNVCVCPEEQSKIHISSTISFSITIHSKHSKFLMLN